MYIPSRAATLGQITEVISLVSSGALEVLVFLHVVSTTTVMR